MGFLGHMVVLFLGCQGTSILFWAPLLAQMVKNSHAMQETQIQATGWEDPLEKGMAIHSSITAWEIPWTEEPGGLQSLFSILSVSIYGVLVF